MNVLVIFGRRSATLLCILYIGEGGGARRGPWGKKDQNTKNSLI